MRRVNITCALCIGALLLVSTSIQADVYRWVDAKGRIHYGDKSPQSVAASKVNMPKAEGSKDDAFQVQPTEINEVDRRQRQKRIIETLSAERKAREDTRQKKRNDKAKTLAKCKRLRIKLDESRSVNVYYRRNEEGERVFISDKERKELDAAAEKTYQENCSR